MIHLRHSAAHTMARRRRAHAAGSALWALLLMCAGAAAAWYTYRLSPVEESGCHLITIPFYPEPAPPPPVRKAFFIFNPDITPDTPDLPVAEPETPPAPTELELAAEYEPDDVLPETDAEALLTPPSPRAPSPQKKIQTQELAATYTPPAYLNNPKPPYPPTLRQRRVQGQVGVLISVAADGTPAEATISSSSGNTTLDRHTCSWILKHWRFTPARQNGRPVCAKVSSLLSYSLHH